MADTGKIALIREAMPAVRNQVYLNTGAVGPLSTITVEALNRANLRELADGRGSHREFLRLRQTLAAAREAFARLVNAGPDEIALTHHTTDGMNIVTHGLAWQPGDEVVTTTAEHEAGLLPLYVLRQRHGVVLKMIDLSPGDIVAQFAEAISPRTRLLVFSHVTWNTGLRLPLAEVVDMAHRHQVLTLVDGAQSAGAIPLDLPASGVDFYALPGQKWLCGPEGVGALYIRQDRLSLVSPTFAGYSTLEEVTMYDFAGYFVPAKSARRYEVATVYRPGIQAMLANLAWLAETIGWEWIHARIRTLAEYAHNALSALPGVSVITPPRPQAGLITFNLEGYDPARVMTRLAGEGIILRFLRSPYALRISTGFYNTEADIDRLMAALQAIQAADPQSLPPYEG